MHSDEKIARKNMANLDPKMSETFPLGYKISGGCQFVHKIL